MKIDRLIHANVVCSDFDKSMTFYRDILGATVYRQFTETKPGVRPTLGLEGDGSLHYRAALLYWGNARRGTYVDLVEWGDRPDGRRSPLGSQDLGLARIALEVDDLDQAERELRDRGVPVLSPPHSGDVGPWRIRFLVCLDPDGTLVELCSFPNRRAKPAGDGRESTRRP
jgi:catechol 2,3-dioxygenase-like lactoylglutathione lyase family enzyme